MKGTISTMTEKIKDFIEKSLKVIKSLPPLVKKGLAMLGDAFNIAKEAAKLAGGFIVEYTLKFTKPLRKWAKPYLIRFGEYAEPKIIRALEVTIKKLEEMSEDYEKRRIARSKLSRREKFFRYFPRVTVATVIALGALFIIGVYHLYLTGGDVPFTRERVGDYLWILLVPSVITVLMLIANVIVSRFDNTEKEAPKENTATAYFKTSASLKNLRESFDYDNAPDDVKEKVLTQYKREKNARISAIVISAISVAYSLLVTFDVGRYTVESVNSDIAGVAYAVLSCVALTLAAWSVHVVIRASARREEILVIRAAIKENKDLFIKQKSEKKSTAVRDNIIRNVARGVIVTASVALILLGIMNGGMADVLSKAVKICTECIGLG